jgi:hypothetical protein
MKNAQHNIFIPGEIQVNKNEFGKQAQYFHHKAIYYINIIVLFLFEIRNSIPLYIKLLSTM